MRRESILKIVVVLFILVVIGIIGGYFYLSHTKTTIQQVRQENGTAGGVAPVGDLPPITQTTNSTQGDNSNPFAGEVPRLRKISVTPVSGADIFYRKEGTTTRAIIRFVDRGTGNIYETSTSSLETIRITNTTIPKIDDAQFGAGGNSALYRFQDDRENIETFIGRVSATSSELLGNFTYLNAEPLTLSPSKNKFFFIIPTGNGAVGYISDFSNKPVQIFIHPLQHWLASWPNESSLVLTTKPTSIAGGVAYQLNVKGGGLTKLFGPKNGLVVLPSPKIDTLLFSETRNETLLAGLYNVNTGQVQYISSATIPDKCIWAPVSKIIYCGTPKYLLSGEYPDIWYEGLVSFNDKITSTNPSFSEISTIIDPGVVSGEEIDATDLHLSPDENYLIFTNKKDLSLWGLRLN